MSSTTPSALWIAVSLVLSVVFWGGNNVGLKYLAHEWPPAWTAAARFIIAGTAMLIVMRWTDWMGKVTRLTPAQNRSLWWRGGVLLAVFMLGCNFAFRYLPASHFALHMAAAPVWALLFEGGLTRSWKTFRQIGAVALAFGGVGVLLWPAFKAVEAGIFGELLGLACGLGWTIYSRQSRHLAQTIPPVEVTARSMWRAGFLLLPFGLLELHSRPIRFDLPNVGALLYCALLGAAAAYGLWNRALTLWPTSRVFLFSNLIPVTTMAGAHAILGEPLTPTFAGAMVLILLGVLLGVVDFGRRVGRWWTPED